MAESSDVQLQQYQAYSDESVAASQKAFEDWVGVKTPGPISVPKETFAQKAESILAGERQLFPSKPVLGQGFLKGTGNLVGNIAKFIPNLATDILRPNAQGVVRTTQAVVGLPGMLGDQKEYQFAQRQLAQMDEKLAIRIKQLKRQNSPQANEVIRKLRESFVSRTLDEVPEPVLPKAFDVTNSQAALEGVSALANALLFKTGGLDSFGSLKATKASLLAPGGVGPVFPLLSKAGATMATAYGIEGAALNALATGALPGDKSFRDYMEAAGLGFVGGAILGPLFGIKLPGYLGRRAANSRIIQDAASEVANLSGKAERSIGELTGFERVQYRNLKNAKVKSLGTDVFSEFDPKNFGVLQHGDVVKLPNGVTGVVSGLRDVTVPNVAEFQKLQTEANQLYSGGRSDSATVERLINVEKRMDDIMLESELAGKPGELAGAARIRQVELRVRLGGELVTTLVEEQKVIGGKILSRERFEFKGIKDLRKTNPELAAKLEQTGNGVARARIQSGNYSEFTDSTSGQKFVILKDGANVSSAEIVERMRAEGFSLFSPDFTPKRATLLNYLFRDTANLRASGTPDEFLIRATDTQEIRAKSMFERLQNRTAPVFQEAGLPDVTTFGGAVRFTFSSDARKKVSALGTRLFKASEGEIPLSDLTTKQKLLVQEWRKISDELITDVNKVLVALGKKPIEGLDNYTTHLIANQARAMLELTGGTNMPDNFLSGILTPKGVAAAKKLPPREVLDKLLMKRTGGLPIEENFFTAVQTAVSTHTRLIHLQPALSEALIAFKYFDKVYGSSHPLNRDLILNLMNRLSGHGVGMQWLRETDKRFMEFLMADKWLAGIVKNPVAKLMTEMMKVEGRADLKVPSNLALSLVKGLGAEQGILSPRNMKKWMYRATLSFSVPFYTMNLSQFWLMAVPKLRGKFGQRYSDAINSWLGAVKNSFSPEMWKHYERLGILNDIAKYDEFEAGLSPHKEVGGLKSSVLDRIFTAMADHSEFINRVSAYEAGKVNIQRNPKLWFDDINKLSNGEIARETERLAKELSDISNFKFGAMHRAPVSDNPVTALWDQYNTFYRNWWGVLKGQLRRMNESPEDLAAIKEMWKGKPEKFLKLMSDENINATRKGEAYRFLVNGAGFITFGAALGGNWIRLATDAYGGGFPRFSSGFADVTEGVLDGDQSKVEKGLANIVLPPALPPAFDLARDAFALRTPEGRVQWVKKMALARYSPFKRVGMESLPAVQAILTGEPVPVFNPKSGEISSIIHPEDAVEKFLFGARSSSSEKINKELDEIHRLKQKSTNISDARLLSARKFLLDIKALPVENKRAFFQSYVEQGKMDEQTLRMVLDIEVGRRHVTESVDRSLSSLPNEQRAQFLADRLKGMDAPERTEYLSSLWMKRVITKETFEETAKLIKDVK